jgi:hypothetical protein
MLADLLRLGSNGLGAAFAGAIPEFLYLVHVEPTGNLKGLFRGPSPASAAI